MARADSFPPMITGAKYNVLIGSYLSQTDTNPQSLGAGEVSHKSALEKQPDFLIRKNGANCESLYGKGIKAGQQKLLSSSFKAVVRDVCVTINNIVGGLSLYQPTAVIPWGEFPMVWYDNDTATYHAYYTKTYSGKPSCYHCYSSNGINWTDDTAHNPVLVPGSGGSWDDAQLYNFSVWKEGSTWYMIYRGNGAKWGLATASAPEGPWTKSGSNPVLVHPKGYDCNGFIKDGSTYYGYGSTTGGDREVYVFKSTNLLTWTLCSADPIFKGGRFCQFTIKYNGRFYAFVSKYYDWGAPTINSRGTIDVYSATDPTFHDKKYEGVIYIDNGGAVDCATIATLTINRDTFPSKFQMWIGQSEDSWHAFYMEATNVATALAAIVMPSSGKIDVSRDIYTLDSPNIYPTFQLDYGIIMDAHGSTFKLKDGYNQTMACSAIMVHDGSVLMNCILDGNKSQQSSGYTYGATISYDAMAFNVRAHSWRGSGINYSSGLLIGCKSYNNTQDGIVIDVGGVLIGCDTHDNARYGIFAGYWNARAYNHRTYRNGSHGAYMTCATDIYYVGQGLPTFPMHVFTGETFFNIGAGIESTFCVLDVHSHENASYGVSLGGVCEGNVWSRHNSSLQVRLAGALRSQLKISVNANGFASAAVVLDANSHYNDLRGKIYNGGSYAFGVDGSDNCVHDMWVEKCAYSGTYMAYSNGARNHFRHIRFRKGGIAVGYGFNLAAASSDNLVEDCDVYDASIPFLRVCYDTGTGNRQRNCTGNPSVQKIPVGYNTGMYPDPSPSGSPYTWTNQPAVNYGPAVRVTVVVSGGTVTAIELAGKSGDTFVTTGLTSGTFYLEPFSQIRITYSVAPTMKVFGY